MGSLLIPVISPQITVVCTKYYRVKPGFPFADLFLTKFSFCQNSFILFLQCFSQMDWGIIIQKLALVWCCCNLHNPSRNSPTSCFPAQFYNFSVLKVVLKSCFLLYSDIQKSLLQSVHSLRPTLSFLCQYDATLWKMCVYYSFLLGGTGQRTTPRPSVSLWKLLFIACCFKGKTWPFD